MRFTQDVDLTIRTGSGWEQGAGAAPTTSRSLRDQSGALKSLPDRGFSLALRKVRSEPFLVGRGRRSSRSSVQHYVMASPPERPNDSPVLGLRELDGLPLHKSVLRIGVIPPASQELVHRRKRGEGFPKQHQPKREPLFEQVDDGSRTGVANGKKAMTHTRTSTTHATTSCSDNSRCHRRPTISPGIPAVVGVRVLADPLGDADSPIPRGGKKRG